MSSNSQVSLRNGKTVTCTSSVNPTKLTHEEEIVNIENNNENANEQAQSGQSSPNPEIDSQRTDDERFSHLQSEMSMLKTMMEKLLEQNEERNRQLDTNAATSSLIFTFDFHNFRKLSCNLSQTTVRNKEHQNQTVMF